MRYVLADIGQPRPVVADDRIIPLRIENVVAEMIELQREEQGLGGDLVVTLLQGLQETASRRIGHLGGVPELSETHRLVEALEDFFVAPDRLAEVSAVDTRQAAGVVGVEGFRLRQRPAQIRIQRGCVRTVVEVGKIPHRRRRRRFRLGRQRSRTLNHMFFPFGLAAHIRERDVPGNGYWGPQPCRKAVLLIRRRRLRGRTSSPCFLSRPTASASGRCCGRNAMAATGR